MNRLFEPVFISRIILVPLLVNLNLNTMGILFISITAGVVILAFILITYFRKNKAKNKPAGPGRHSVVETKSGVEKGIYD
ncbi:MAG: hypothetical protein ACTHM5_02980 [Ginsengibacter sp.]